MGNRIFWIDYDFSISNIGDKMKKITLKEVQENLINKFDFDSMIKDLTIMDDINSLSKKEELKEIAPKLIKHIFTFETGISVSNWYSHLCATRTYINDETIYSLECKINKHSRVFVCFQGESK